VSFRSHARTVLDPTAPLLVRKAALRRCVTEYAPYGYRATLRHLEQRFDGLADADALTAALSELDGSRSAWLAEVEDFARRRREAKARGQRRASRVEVTRYHDQGWPGTADRAGPRVAERFLRRYGMTLWTPEPVNHRRRVRRLPKPLPPRGVLVGTLGCGGLGLVLIALAGWVLVRPAPLGWWAFLGLGTIALTLLGVAMTAGDRLVRRLVEREYAVVVDAADRAEERLLTDRHRTSAPD
jgi:hypothetical protein